MMRKGRADPYNSAQMQILATGASVVWGSTCDEALRPASNVGDVDPEARPFSPFSAISASLLTNLHSHLRLGGDRLSKLRFVTLHPHVPPGLAERPHDPVIDALDPVSAGWLSPEAMMSISAAIWAQ